MSTLRSSNLEVRYSQKEFIELQELQNHEYFVNRDIITITGFMQTEEEITRHLNDMKSLIM